MKLVQKGMLKSIHGELYGHTHQTVHGNMRYQPLNMADSKTGSSNLFVNLAIESKL